MSHLSPNPSEVERVFSRPISQLQSNEYKVYETISRSGVSMKMPVFGPDAGDERIWGLTAIILDGTLKNYILPIFRKSHQDQSDVLKSI